MASTNKGQKDTKYHPASPRLTPRPTAASVARAARIATNRNAAPIPTTKSPTRATHAPIPKDTKPTEAFIKSDQVDPTSECSEINTPTNDPDGTYIVSKDAIVPIQEASEDNYQLPDNSDVLVVPVAADCESPSIDEVIHDEKNLDNTLDKNQSQPHTPATSRPVTPKFPSRPQTPQYPSRPQTPRLPSRPTTPNYAPQRTNTPTSRPTTPQHQNIINRNRTSSIPLPSRTHTPGSLGDKASNLRQEDEDVKTAFVVKRKVFHNMKKELDLKQQEILEVFDSLQGMSKRLCQEGTPGAGEGIQLQDLVVFNVADWTADEVARLCQDAAAASNTDGAKEIFNAVAQYDEDSVAEMHARVATMPVRFADLCIQAFSARQEIIDWVKELVQNTEIGSGETIDRIAQYNSQGFEFCDKLRDLKNMADDQIEAVTQLSRRAVRERSALITVGESLVREIARLRLEFETHSVAIAELRDSKLETKHTKIIEDLRRELEEEKIAKSAAKEKLATTESQLRQTRTRVSKMDRQLREAEASIASLTGTVKSLEDQSRQREVQLEARARKLRESLKTGEVTTSQLAQQRNLLQEEVQELKEQINTMTEQHKASIQELNSELNKMRKSLEEQRDIAQKERELKQANEQALAQTRALLEEMEAKVSSFENSKPNPDLPTEREMELWAELQSTKETLRMTEDEINSCKREKVRFLETLTKIAETDSKVGLQQKLAAELVSKEEILGKMQAQMRELTKSLKLNEQKVLQYEQYVRDYLTHSRAIASSLEDPTKAIEYHNLQQEIVNLRMSLLDSVNRNEDLAELAAQKDQQIEQQEKTSRAQARVIKVREELINLLKNKEAEQSRELNNLQQDLEQRMKIVDEVNHQIAAKANEIQELFTTLESKQQQIHRLEKIVLALEEQQRRAQAQRTRHEEKIAALEHELAAGGNRRERKYLFF